MNDVPKIKSRLVSSFTIFLITIPSSPSFEIPAKIKKLSSTNKYDCLIALGCIIKGETDHYHYIANAVTNGLMEVTLNVGSPIIFGVLTCQNVGLAISRSGRKNKQNKGYEAGLAAIEQLKDQ